MAVLKKIVAVGDCNTLGADNLEKKSFPERFGILTGVQVLNVGHTMATTREGIHLLKNFLSEGDWVFIQFGLVDSYKTFKYSPYVLYYPDNMLRKPLRSLVKKYKKTCKKIGLNVFFGEINVVAIEEYKENIRQMIEFSRPGIVVLLDTVPNKQLWRNPEIKRYNSILTILSEEYENCLKVDLYDDFEANFDTFYMDETHCNEAGYNRIAERIREKVELLLL